MPVYVSDLLTATAAPVNAVPTATRSWQWLRGSTAISGATSSTYTAVTADIGATIAASQIETNVAGSATATSAPTEVIQAFDPIRLFSASEPGVWYDPNDISTLFKGPTVQAPVTTPGDSVWLMLDKSRGGPGPELVPATYSGTPANAAWSLSGNSIVRTTAAAGGAFDLTIGNVNAGKTYRITCDVAGLTGDTFTMAFLGGANVGQITTNGSKSFIATATTTTVLRVYAWAGTLGTVTVTNISISERPGNHATQSITASQPIYGIVPAGGRRNLILYSEQMDNAFWVKVGLNAFGSGSVVNTTATTDPVGGNTAEYIQENSASGDHTAYVNGINLTAAPHTFTVYCKSAQRTWVYVRLAKAAGQGAYFNLSSGTVGTVEAGITAAITPVGTTGWYRCSVTITTDTTPWYPTILMATGDNQGAYTGNGTSGIFIWGAQLEQSATATPYQRVTTQYDVTEAGVASLGYLYFDGASDAMVTSTITPGTDKAQVFAGVRKLSDANFSVIAEFTSDPATLPGSWTLIGSAATSGAYLFGGRGTTQLERRSDFLLAPRTNVLTGLYNIGGSTADEEVSARINGASAALTTYAGTSLGSGNYANAPLYLGARGGTGLPANMNLYSLITRFGPNLTTARISATESWVASKTAGAPAL